MRATDGENTTIKNMETSECLELLEAEGVQRTLANRNAESPKFIPKFSSRLQERKIPIVYRINSMDIIGKFREDR
ncbi:hypothetical protein SAMN05421636_105220 [Pricia antarctica]|uniref:Uncharacterized protein n=1 Tax=Pricia antarctica TaxID=641691 RepID=A0A1G7D8N8_9FLAO|nr:hypothetical protein [Pricia antarctica]SDE47998.1 hypothetical protein SAMN05421636_105220 [Pricia antarctica]